MFYVRAKPEHPTLKKVERLFALADELNISIGALAPLVQVHDHDTGEVWRLMDLEDSPNGQGSCYSVPHPTEFKLVREA